MLTETDQFEASSYRPKTKETQAAYELVLAFVRSCIGDQPQEVLRGAADEVPQHIPQLRLIRVQSCHLRGSTTANCLHGFSVACVCIGLNGLCFARVFDMRRCACTA